jgi:hypothetical protein
VKTNLNPDFTEGVYLSSIQEEEAAERESFLLYKEKGF